MLGPRSSSRKSVFLSRAYSKPVTKVRLDHLVLPYPFLVFKVPANPVCATVPYYQPETAYQIFNRVMFNTDVARGKNPSANYSTKGPSSAFTKSEVNAQPGQSPCYLWDILETCTKSQKQILQNGTAIVENFIPVGQKQANGSTVFYNGTSGGGNGARSNSSGAGTTFSSVASPMAPFRAMNTTVLSAAALVVLQTTFF